MKDDKRLRGQRHMKNNFQGRNYQEQLDQSDKNNSD